MDLENYIKLANKQIKTGRYRVTMGIKNDNFPVGENFECPLCHYVPASARIYQNDTGLLFNCFACKEVRTVHEN